MIFEALVPFTLNTKTRGVLQLKAGQQMDVPAKVVQQLQAKVPEKIRVLEWRSPIQAGVWVEFFSPLWGLCSAEVQAVTLRGCVLTNHSVLRGEGEPVTIPASWVRNIYRKRKEREP